MNEYDLIKQLLEGLGYTEIQEDILINGDYFHYFFNPKTKERINLSLENA